MLPISVIIITKNEAINIKDCIKSAMLISNDIIVADSGSTDGTLEIIKTENVSLINIEWQGYGNARNIATQHAKYDWIFALDADERITPSLVDQLKSLESLENGIVYGFIRKNYFYGRKIRFGGNFGKDKVFRLYNKLFFEWDKAQVHEVLVGENMVKKLIGGKLAHFTVRTWDESEIKIYKYAKLNAEKYFEQRKRASLIKRFISPLIGFIKHYIVLLGFLDGKVGFLVSYSNAKCTWLKYKYLYQMHKK